MFEPGCQTHFPIEGKSGARLFFSGKSGLAERLPIQIKYNARDMRKSANHEQICWDILPAVSRSFALCIQKLPKGLDERMMIAYLILRLIDTIEDSPAPVETKRAAFDQILELLAATPPVNRQKAAAYRDFLLTNIDYSYEKILLENLQSLLEVFHGFNAEEKSAILGCAREMAEGMLKFQGKAIESLTVQEEYCYYVAGIVGHLNSRLFHLSGQLLENPDERFLELAKRFGIALQKVNILRDVAYDVPQGRNFWPLDLLKAHGLSYETLCLPENRKAAMAVLEVIVKDALPYLEDALAYTKRIPRSSIRVRVFCLIPLFMAVESYAKCVDNEDIFNSGKTVKISKSDVARIVRNSFLLAPSNWALQQWFNIGLRTVRQKLARK